MKKTSFKKVLSLTLCIVLIAVIALFATGCGNNTDNNPTESGAPTEATGTVVSVLGEGDTVFTFKVTDLDGKVCEFEIHTDKEIVGDALQELKLIEGDEGPYGLYVKTVNGTTVDYDTDGKYWAFYENGTLASVGVDSTKITEGTIYEFKAE